jgi:hypothetical protein
MSLFVKTCYMFRPCWVIFRENSLVTLLYALTELSENVPLLSSSVVRCLVLSAPRRPQYKVFRQSTHEGGKVVSHTHRMMMMIMMMTTTTTTA